MVWRFTAGETQLGPISRDDSRISVIAWLLENQRTASLNGCTLVFFSEQALNTDFLCWVYKGQAGPEDHRKTKMLSRVTQMDGAYAVLGISLLGAITAAVPELEGMIR